MIYSTKLIASANRLMMKKALLVLFLVFFLFPINSSFGGLAETDPTLGISLTSYTPYNFKNDEGKTVIIGEIVNTKNFPITGVKIWAGFYDQINSQPLESTIGTSIIEVIPPFAKVPYIIISPTANSAISGVSVNLLGFNSATPKQDWLSLEPGVVDISEQISVSGKLINTSPLGDKNIKIHLAAYDAFIPPRILNIETQLIEDIDPGQTIEFEFLTKEDSRTISYKLIAESESSVSNVIEMNMPNVESLNKLVTINDISLTDAQGNRVSDIVIDSPINIQSKIWIQFSSSSESTNQPYVYYVQIKESETGMVEYIGKAEGAFETGGTQIPFIEWTPERNGLYFAETFVWDPNAVPLASKGPLTLLLVN